MISNPRHGSPPRLMAHQPTRCSTTQKSSIRVHRPEPVLLVRSDETAERTDEVRDGPSMWVGQSSRSHDCRSGSSRLLITGEQDRVSGHKWAGLPDLTITPRVLTLSGFAAPAADPPFAHRSRRRFEMPSAPPSARPPSHP